MHINQNVFREYDIRGIAGTDLSPGFAAGLGLAFTRRLAGKESAGPVLVGHDNRVSSPEYSRALISGLNAGGREVVFLGEVPTPVFYHAAHAGGFPAGIMVTASHNPPEYNGFKIIAGGHSVHGQAIRALGKLMAAPGFTVAAGEPVFTPREAAGAYRAEIAGQVRPARPVKVVLDCGNGVAGPVALPLLRQIGAAVIPLYCESDNTFPNHPPDPVVPENMRDLAAKVRETGAALGVGIDGDGDRIGLCDEQGNLLWGDVILALLLRDILPTRPGAPVVFDVKCSRALAEEITRLGGRPEMWKTGHSLIEARMHELSAPAGGELSGHIYLADRWPGFDDAIYTAARFLEFFAGQDRPLSALAAELPRYHASPEIRIDVPDEEKFALVDRLKRQLAATGAEISDIDGVKVVFADGWGLVRASNTQPALVLRFEARSRARRQEIEKNIRGELETLLKKNS